MKFISRFTILIYLFGFLTTGNLYGQDDKKKIEDQIKQENAQAEKVIDILNFLNKRVITDLDKNKLCKEEAELYLKQIKFDPELAKFHIAMHNTAFFHYKEPNGIVPHNFLTWGDYALSIYSSTKDKNEFSKKLFDKTIRELTNEQKKAIDHLFNVYSGQAFQYLYVRWITKEFNKCQRVYNELKFYPNTFKYPFIEWRFSYTTSFYCSCTKERTNANIRTLSANYVGDIKSVVTSEGMIFNIPTNIKGRNDLDCCGKTTGSEEDPPKTEIPKEQEPKKYSTDGKPISYEPATHNIGTGIGLSFEDKFKDVGIGTFAEYLYLLDLKEEFGDLIWFLGAEAEFNAIISEFFKSTIVSVGPKIQMNKRLPKVGNLQLVNGIKTQYSYTNNNSNGFKSNAHGFNIGLYTGFNFPIGDKLDLGLEIPVFNINYSATKLENVDGRQKNTNISLLMNNNNLMKFLLRIRLGE